MDLVLIRLPGPVAGAPGAEIRPVVAQEDCNFKDIVMQAYLRMRAPHEDLPRSQMNVRDVIIDRMGPSQLASGTALISDTRVGTAGDSGSPLMRPDGVQVGVLNGNVFGQTFFAALCKYSNDIKKFSDELHGKKFP